MRFVLGLSLALNLLLLTSMVAARIDTGLADVTAAAAMIRDIEGADPPHGREVGTLPELLDILEASDLGPDQIKTLALGWLEARHRSSHAPAAPRYWERGYSPGRDALAAQYAAESAIRAALIETFGADAVDDPAFDAAFRPLGPAYGFLGSSAQLALQAAQLGQLADEGRAGAARPSGVMLCRAGTGRTSPRAGPRPAVELSPAEDEAYRLRFSPLAAQLRDAGIASGEAEFRELYELVAPLEQAMTPSEQAELRRRLRLRLGDDRFDRFWSARDPAFEVVNEYLSRQGLAGHQAMAVYGVVNRSQEALLSVLGRSGDVVATAAAGQKIRQDETSDLSRLLGPEVAAGLQAAMNEFALGLSQQSDSAC